MTAPAIFAKGGFGDSSRCRPAATTTTHSGERDGISLCQVFFDEKKLNALPEAELSTLVEEPLDYDDQLRMQQHFVAAQALEPLGAAKTVRVRSGELLVTDGPFAETRETDWWLHSDRRQ